MLDRAEAERIIAAPKDAGGAMAAWNETTLPDGVPLRKSLQFLVTVDPAPESGHLLVHGEWKSPQQIEIFLYSVEGPSQKKLARLCLTPGHGDDLHWHLYEDMKGSSPTEPALSDPNVMLEENWMLDQVFIPRLQITNLARPLL